MELYGTLWNFTELYVIFFLIFLNFLGLYGVLYLYGLLWTFLDHPFGQRIVLMCQNMWLKVNLLDQWVLGYLGMCVNDRQTFETQLTMTMEIKVFSIDE